MSVATWPAPSDDQGMAGASPLPDDFARPACPVSVGGVGAPGTLLLSGPGLGATERLDAHLERWGELPGVDGTQVRSLLRSSGLDGRGVGAFRCPARWRQHVWLSVNHW